MQSHLRPSKFLRETKETRCRALTEFANVRNEITINYFYKKKEYNGFSKVLFTDESRITLDGLVRLA